MDDGVRRGRLLRGAGRSGARRGCRHPGCRGSRPRRAGGATSSVNARRSAPRADAVEPARAAARPSTSESRSRAWAVRSSSCSAHSRLHPDPVDRKSIAAPRPMASATFDVPASKLAVGTPPRRIRQRRREEIMWPPPRNGGISSQQPWAAVQHADAGRPVGLVAGPGVEARRRSRRGLDRHLRHGLRAVDDADGARRARPLGDQVGDRVDRARATFETWTIAATFTPPPCEQRVERVEIERARPRRTGAYDQLGPHLAAEHVPGDEVRVVLHLGDEHPVVRRRRDARPHA